jgi:predicted transcriptional regulator YdeE
VGEVHAERPRSEDPEDDDRTYVVYCDYENDWRGAYTMVLGARCDASAAIPEGMRRVRVPSGRYESIPVQGDPAQVIWRAWMWINEEWQPPRRYIADVERYDAPDRAELLLGLG